MWKWFFKGKDLLKCETKSFYHLSAKLAQLVNCYADKIMGLNLMSWFIWMHATGANKFHD